MDLARTAEYSLRLTHRHNDGSWSQLEKQSHNDAAAHDPERDWSGTLYICKKCDEQVVVESVDDPSEQRR